MNLVFHKRDQLNITVKLSLFHGYSTVAYLCTKWELQMSISKLDDYREEVLSKPVSTFEELMDENLELQNRIVNLRLQIQELRNIIKAYDEAVLEALK